MKKIAPLTQATWSQKIILFSIFPQTKMVFLRGKIAKNQLHLAKFGCVSGAISIFRKPCLWQIGVVTKYRWLNATKWPQMPQKWVNTIPFGSGHTLVWGYYFAVLSLFLAPGVAWTPPGAPWPPLGPLVPPGAPLDPLVLPRPLVCHPRS